MKTQPMTLRHINTTDLLLFKTEFIMTEEEEQNLKDSLSENGFLVPIYVRPILQHNYEVIDGKKRVLVALKLGIERIPCIVYEYMGDASAKDYEKKLREVNNKINPGYEKEVSELLTTVREIVENFQTKIGASIETIGNTRQQQELFQTVCTAYSLEAAECMCELRKINSNNKEVETVMNSLRKTQEYMLNVQHRVGVSNMQLMEMEEQIIKTYNLIIDSLDLVNKLHKYYQDKQIF